MAGKRRFGRVRKLPSGRFQARYPGPDGADRAAPHTFASKGDADAWLVLKEAEIRRGEWLDPNAGKIKFEVFATRWVDERVLKPRTDGLYRGLLRNHLVPTFGNYDLADIRESDVRRWRKERTTSTSAPVRRKGRSLLKEISSRARRKRRTSAISISTRR